MTEPFTFNPALIRRAPAADKYGRQLVEVWYALPMPDGGKIGLLVEANSQRADMMAQRKLEATFRHHMDGLSAHARLAWAEAAQGVANA